MNRPQEDGGSSSDEEAPRPGASTNPPPRGPTTTNPSLAKLPLSIRTLDGRTYKLTAMTDWTVRRLKEEFEKYRGEGAAHCILFFRAKRLADNDTLSKYNIQADSVIQANFRSTGGLN